MPHSMQSFTLKRADAESRIPHGSFLSLRTFYAFGARSGRVPSLQRSLSYHTCGSSLGAGPMLQSIETNSILRRSSTAVSIQKLKHNVAYYNRCFTSLYNNSRTYSNSITQNRTSTNYQSSTSQLKREHRQYQTENTGSISLPKISRNAVTSVAQSSAISAQSTSQRDVTSTRLQCKESENAEESLLDKDEISVSKENSLEMAALMDRNKFLEAEVERLKSRLRDKERSERELKRKLLEYAAEVKVWRKKCEMQQTVSAEISESKGNEEEISDIMEQLNTAAEKLTRLNAVKDLKLLQSEMETALKEISK